MKSTVNVEVIEFVRNYLDLNESMVTEMTDMEIMSTLEDLYISGNHPAVEMFVDNNQDLFE